MPLRRSPVPGLPDPATNTNTVDPPRITPRNSDGDEAIAAAAAKETPYNTLRQLANLPRPTTPLRRASSAGPPTQRSLRRTPGQARTPALLQRQGGSARRTNVLTPHGRAAMREVEARRAGLTPAKNRRQSGRQQRETPRDVLRALSRILAPKTLPTVPTPQGATPSGRSRLAGDEDFDDDSALERPRLSLALGEDDEDDSLLLPPQSAGLEDENLTARSVELGRRAVSEQPGRLSRGSFGSIRMSDQFNNVEGVFDSPFAMGGGFNDDDALDMSDGPREETATLRNLNLERGRLSDIRPAAFTGDETENTFVFNVPQRELQERDYSMPDIQDSPILEDNMNFDLDEVEGLNADEPDEPEEVEDPVSESEMGSPKPADADISLHDTTMQSMDASVLEVQQKAARKKKVKVSKHGIQYPSLPAGVVKKLATTYARTSGNSKAKINKETLDAIIQASDWFFEQVSEDLGAYAQHAGRKTIDESDVITLMKRQRQINANTTPFSLAERYLPRELLQELRMVPLPKMKRGKQLDIVEEADED